MDLPPLDLVAHSVRPSRIEALFIRFWGLLPAERGAEQVFGKAADVVVPVPYHSARPQLLAHLGM